MKNLVFACCVALIFVASACNSSGTENTETPPAAPTAPAPPASPGVPVPDYTIDNLEEMFGKATQAGNGSGVFWTAQAMDKTIDSIAMADYSTYLGTKLATDAAPRWIKGWRKVFTRTADSIFNIIREINTIPDPRVKQSLPLLLEFVEPVVKARQALAGAFNRPDAKQLSVYTIGDGEAYSGIMITAKYEDGSACSLIAMTD